MKNKIVPFLKDNNVSIFKKLLFVFPVIYFLSPITIIPYYFFPLAGWLDNIFVAGGMVIYLKKMLDNYDPYKSISSSKDQKNKKSGGKDHNVIDLDEYK